ncbi:MAG: DsbA family protein, partial [Limisphaerales bacterium]
PLIDAMRPTGLTHDKAMACLRDDRLAKKIEDIAKIAVDVVKLEGTPTFVIDGKVYDGELSFDELDAILKPPVK